ncbi:hypothetical protein CRUP_030932, partial [Coryphaenoides rupestris]
MASPFTASQLPICRRRSSKMGAMRPSWVGPTFTSRLPPRDTVCTRVVQLRQRLGLGEVAGPEAVGGVGAEQRVEPLEERVVQSEAQVAVGAQGVGQRTHQNHSLPKLGTEKTPQWMKTPTLAWSNQPGSGRASRDSQGTRTAAAEAAASLLVTMKVMKHKETVRTPPSPPAMVTSQRLKSTMAALVDCHCHLSAGDFDKGTRTAAAEAAASLLVTMKVMKHKETVRTPPSLPAMAGLLGILAVAEHAGEFDKIIQLSQRLVGGEGDKDRQRQVLVRQAEVAKRLDLPLNVHSRIGRKANHPAKQKLVKQLPLENICLETDSPALGPEKQVI